jgi:hypothetical protein
MKTTEAGGRKGEMKKRKREERERRRNTPLHAISWEGFARYLSMELERLVRWCTMMSQRLQKNDKRWWIHLQTTAEEGRGNRDEKEKGKEGGED